MSILTIIVSLAQSFIPQGPFKSIIGQIFIPLKDGLTGVLLAKMYLHIHKPKKEEVEIQVKQRMAQEVGRQNDNVPPEILEMKKSLLNEGSFLPMNR
jgi:hypothetical protein